MAPDRVRPNAGNSANSGGKGGLNSQQQEVRYKGSDGLKRSADLRTTMTTSGSLGKRDPTPARNAGRAAGSGAQRRSRSRSQARSRSRSRARSRE